MSNGTRVCLGCHSELADSRRRYCSEGCRPRCSRSGCGKPVKSRGLCLSHYGADFRKRVPKHSYVCDWCGVEFSTGRKRTRELKFCCRDHQCKYVAKDSGFAEKRAATVRKAWLDKFTKDLVLYVPPRRVPVRRVNPIPPNRAPWKSCSCEICGLVFLSKQYEKSCSDGCAEVRGRLVKRAVEDRRRALKRNAFVAPVFRLQVFKRDDYRCQLCGGKMEMDAVAPDPLSPTIDHILPLARGGTHEPANVQSAHFLCNATKGDRGGGEQLALIG